MGIWGLLFSGGPEPWENDEPEVKLSSSLRSLFPDRRSAAFVWYHLGRDDLRALMIIQFEDFLFSKKELCIELIEMSMSICLRNFYDLDAILHLCLSL